MMNKMEAIAFCLIYLSLCLGVCLKFCQYKLKNNKVIYSLVSSIMVNVLAASMAWKYVKSKEKEEQATFSMMDKVVFMLQLFKLNIQCFPALVGFFAVILVNQKKLDMQFNKKVVQII